MAVRDNLVRGGIDTSDANATASDILITKSAYVNGVKILGSMTNVGAQTASITPSTTTQTVTIQEGYHNGQGQIVVGAGLDTSDATASAGDILSGETAYISTGKATGTMPNRGAVSETLDTTNVSYTVPDGYHNGNGTVSIDLQSKQATPTGTAQTISADNGKVLGTVTVGAVTTSSGIGKDCYDSGYSTGHADGVADTKVGTASAGDVLSGKTFTNATSVGANGTMTNQGAWTASTSGSGSVTIPAGYHNGSGYVSGANSYNSGYSAGVTAARVGTAGTAQVLSGYTFTNNSGTYSGAMVNKGAWTTSVTPSSSAQTVTIPQGYHNGNGYVSVGASSGVLNTSGRQVADFEADSATVTCPYTLQQGKNYLVIKDNSIPLTATYTPGIKNMGSLVPITYQLSVGASKTFGLLYMNGTTQPTFTGSVISTCNIKIVEF